MVSAADLLRGLLGVPARHPAAFPHLDEELHVSWTDDEMLDLDRLNNAPEGPGVIVLVRGGRGVAETSVWAEGCERLHMRLEELLTIPQRDSPLLAAILAHGGLRYRVAAVPDATKRSHIADVLMERIGHHPLPASAVPA